ncbi:MAG TPA: biosynthetic arginine decarboxylase [Gammaproteobacteria bacterium]|nr:biosynthetic arginine decarboxylase [Gammaproteobacteria bacterium]
MNEWSVQQSRDLYNITHWSDGYFDINDQGRLVAYPDGRRDLPGIDLIELANTMYEKEGLPLPILVRFADILHQRFKRLQQAFARAMQEYEYQGEFMSVYPIKANQQRRVVEEILRYSNKEHPIGLEAGSKPELLAVMALSAPNGSVIVCNGYKDREYIRLALIGQRLGHRVYIILEKLTELDVILDEANKMGVTPTLGIRVRLASMAAGKWQHTGGEKSKFGFSAAQVLLVVERLQAAGCLNILQLLHFHLGSQIANIADIQRGMRECARYYSELRALGVPIDTVDVGGGLAVDYEGTRSRSFCSMNYSMREYANNIVYTLEEICKQNNLPHPRIITESGRAMVAHHALLITNVIEVERTLMLKSELEPVLADDPLVLRELWDGLINLSERSALEVYHDACNWMSEVHSMYNHGIISLPERARAEQIYLTTCIKVRDLLKHSVRAHREVLDEINEKLADKYFCNFSLFQSLPDAWAIDQVFPIMPLSGLDQKPVCRGVVQDLTCDSDGRIDCYVDGEGVDTTLPLLPYQADKPYLLGIFLVGAYQETLGDLHNLFGDTHSVVVEMLPEGGYRLVHPVKGDMVEDVLRYVQFDSKELLAAYHQQFARANLSQKEAQDYLETLTEGLGGYTYLED